MKQLLVSMNGRKVPWEALSRAIALAKRLEARVHVLVVAPRESALEVLDPTSRNTLEQRVRAAGEDGVRVDSFFAEGNYEEEVVSFVKHNKINLLITEHDHNDARGAERESASLQTIRHRVSCPVEIVTPRKSEQRGSGI